MSCMTTLLDPDSTPQPRMVLEDEEGRTHTPVENGPDPLGSVVRAVPHWMPWPAAKVRPLPISPLVAVVLELVGVVRPVSSASVSPRWITLA